LLRKPHAKYYLIIYKYYRIRGVREQGVEVGEHNALQDTPNIGYVG